MTDEKIFSLKKNIVPVNILNADHEMSRNHGEHNVKYLGGICG